MIYQCPNMSLLLILLSERCQHGISMRGEMDLFQQRTSYHQRSNDSEVTQISLPLARNLTAKKSTKVIRQDWVRCIAYGSRKFPEKILKGNEQIKHQALIRLVDSAGPLTGQLNPWHNLVYRVCTPKVSEDMAMSEEYCKADSF